MSVLAAFVMPHPPIIMPNIGKGEERKIAATSNSCEECGRIIAEIKPEVIILCSPHAKAYSDEFYVSEPYEPLDHGVYVPLYFINNHYEDYSLVRISVSGLSLQEHYDFGKKVAASVSDKRVVFIASGDLSHKLKHDGPYGFAEEGVIFDKTVTEILSSGDFDKLLNIDEELVEAAAECGLRPLVMMAGVLDGVEVTSELLSYENTFGVGYAVAKYIVKE